jgi:hypothetical protein
MAGVFQLTMDSHKNEKFTADEMVTDPVESEWDERHNRRLTLSRQRAKFVYKASLEESCSFSLSGIFIFL